MSPTKLERLKAAGFWIFTLAMIVPAVWFGVVYAADHARGLLHAVLLFWVGCTMVGMMTIVVVTSVMGLLLVLWSIWHRWGPLTRLESQVACYAAEQAEQPIHVERIAEALQQSPETCEAAVARLVHKKRLRVAIEQKGWSPRDSRQIVAVWFNPRGAT